MPGSSDLRLHFVKVAQASPAWYSAGWMRLVRGCGGSLDDPEI